MLTFILSPGALFYLRRLEGTIRDKLMKDGVAFLLGLKILVGFDLMGKAVLGTRSNLYKDMGAVKRGHM